MIHNDADAADRRRSRDLRGARRRRAAHLRAGERAADGAALLPVLIRVPCSSSASASPRNRCHDALLTLPFEQRQKSRLRATARSTASEVGLFLERGTVLRGGDCLRGRGRPRRTRRRRRRAADGGAQRRCRARSRAPPITSATGTRRCRWASTAGCASPPTTCSARCCAASGVAVTALSRAVRARGRRLRGGPPSPFGRSQARRRHPRFRDARGPARVKREAALEVGDARPPPQAPISLVRLLQLASPALPIGAYSYSQGLEWAVDAGTVHDAASAQRWIGDLLELVLARGDAPMLVRLLDAASAARLAMRWPHGTRGFALPARPRSSAPRREQMGIRSRGCSSTSRCSTPRPAWCCRASPR